MFKQLLLTVLILMFSVSMAVAGCIVPENTDVMLFTEFGMSRTTPTTDRPVKEVSPQPEPTLLKEFSDNADEDWTDGVIILDEELAIYLLVHKKDIVGECEIVEVDMK